MASAVSVFEEQAAGYDRYVREHWNDLEQWERDQHAQFSSWATNRNIVRRFVASPVERRASHRPRSQAEAFGGRRGSMRTVSLGYALILTSVLFFPLVFGGAAIALGFVNVLRRSWDHGLIQIALASTVIAAFVYGLSMSDLTMPHVQDLFGLTVPYVRSLIASIR